MKKHARITSIVVLTAVVLVAVIFGVRLALVSLNAPIKNLSTQITPGMPYVKGAQVFDGSNHPLTLRGAMLETSFAYIKQWQSGQDPLTYLNTATYQAMVQKWHMNAIRINVSQWIYNLGPTVYQAKLDTAIREANAAGMYVILDFHNDVQSGAVAPYNDGMLHTVSLGWWKIIAKHYVNNPMILFDIINEPHYPSWSIWLHGDGADVVGITNVIAAIRSTGARQLIVLEPGTAGGGTFEQGGWTSFDPTTISDPSIVYSKHLYSGIITGNPTIWDRDWGTLLNTHPIYYGEWAVLPSPLSLNHCTGLTSANADAVTNAFLNYMGQRNASWTAWTFKPSNLIHDTASFTPTSFAVGKPWVCGDSIATQAGMGKDVQTYLIHSATSAP